MPSAIPGTILFVKPIQSCVVLSENEIELTGSLLSLGSFVFRAKLSLNTEKEHVVIMISASNPEHANGSSILSLASKPESNLSKLVRLFYFGSWLRK